MSRERLTRYELEEYCENAGLTALQKDILRLRYYDDRDLSVVQICLELHISHNKFYSNHNKILKQIYKYEMQKQ